MEEKIGYNEICQYLGQLYLESRHNMEKLQREASTAIKGLTEKLSSKDKRVAELETQLRERDSKDTSRDN